MTSALGFKARVNFDGQFCSLSHSLAEIDERQYTTVLIKNSKRKDIGAFDMYVHFRSQMSFKLMQKSMESISLMDIQHQGSGAY